MPTPVPTSGLRPVQRTAAYAVVRDDAGGLLLVRGSARSDLTGRWFLPGGGVGHGEHPAEACVREVLEETGVAVTLTGLREAVSDVIDLPHRGVRVHTVRVLYDAVPVDGADGLRPERDGTSDRAEFVPPGRLGELPLMPYVARLVGLPADDVHAAPPERPEPLGGDAHDANDVGDVGENGAPARFQRVAAYAVLRDDDAGHERILLTRFGRDGIWTLPGGGIDHGEAPLDAVVREVHEEAGLRLSPGRLVHVSSSHFTGRAPGGRTEDYHGIGLVYVGTVPADVEPRVVEVGGSTDAVAWFPVPELGSVRLGRVVAPALAAATAATAAGG